MAILRHGDSPKLYFKFKFNNKQIFRSAKTTNEKIAKQRELDCRIKLEKEAALLAATPDDQKPLPEAPTLLEFAKIPDENDTEMPLGGRWWVEFGTKTLAKSPRTRAYYEQRLTALLGFERLAHCRLDKINKVVLDPYMAERMNTVKGATINRDFAVLRAILNCALDWEIIRKVPKFRLFKEERVGVAITPEQETIYLAAVTQDHRDFCAIMSTAMEPGVAAELKWSDVHLGPIGKYTHGYIFDRCQKTKFRERELGLNAPLATTLKERWLRMGRPESGYVFPSDRTDLNGKPHPMTLARFQSEHKRLWIETPDHAPIAIPKFRLYDLRHTALTRAVASGANAFDLKQMAGWSTIRMADHYIHLDQRDRARATDRYSDYLISEKNRIAKAAGSKS